MSDLEERVFALENAITSLAEAEFGDSPGHPFRGNQHSEGGDKAATSKVTSYDPKTGPSEDEKRANYIRMHGKPPPD